jgi:hypothetical protein
LLLRGRSSSVVLNYLGFQSIETCKGWNEMTLLPCSLGRGGASSEKRLPRLWVPTKSDEMARDRSLIYGSQFLSCILSDDTRLHTGIGGDDMTSLWQLVLSATRKILGRYSRSKPSFSIGASDLLDLQDSTTQEFLHIQSINLYTTPRASCLHRSC